MADVVLFLPSLERRYILLSSDIKFQTTSCAWISVIGRSHDVRELSKGKKISSTWSLEDIYYYYDFPLFAITLSKVAGRQKGTKQKSC